MLPETTADLRARRSLSWPHLRLLVLCLLSLCFSFPRVKQEESIIAHYRMRQIEGIQIMCAYFTAFGMFIKSLKVLSTK